MKSNDFISYFQYIIQFKLSAMSKRQRKKKKKDILQIEFYIVYSAIQCASFHVERIGLA